MFFPCRLEGTGSMWFNWCFCLLRCQMVKWLLCRGHKHSYFPASLVWTILLGRSTQSAEFINQCLITVQGHPFSETVQCASVCVCVFYSSPKSWKPWNASETDQCSCNNKAACWALKATVVAVGLMYTFTHKHTHLPSLIMIYALPVRQACINVAVTNTHTFTHSYNTQ